ncbi:retrovirus-related pol polyprotein from transposon TNT 1-94 [Tanacetum coccineum]|uniref:Retrovirus-related pol polyprotein from transposon TNT 1-94 n=1 Tax=Tanacetum coccineum TaxID=301880 RepID=A0ABQ5ICF7_9ASTR
MRNEKKEGEEEGKKEKKSREEEEKRIKEKRRKERKKEKREGEKGGERRRRKERMRTRKKERRKGNRREKEREEEKSDIRGAFKQDVIPFSANLKETFKLFEKGFIATVTEMKDICKHMEDEVDQFSMKVVEVSDIVLFDLQESNKSLCELRKCFAKLEEYNITLDIAFQNHKEQMILNDPEMKNKQFLVQKINNQSFEDKFISKFGNNHLAAIIGYGDLQLRNILISRVYYIEGRELGSVDLLSGSHGSNLYTISMADIMKSSPILRYLRTNIGIEFLNQTLQSYTKEVGITHHTSTTRTPQQNGVIERRNCTLVEAGRTMLIFSKFPLFLWAEARSQTRTQVSLCFGALCDPTNDFKDIGKLPQKADIGIFIGYSPSKKAYWIYNKRTKQIMETMNVQFDELTHMASKQHGSGPNCYGLTSGHISSGLMLNQTASTSAKPPTKNE